ncbi:MAG: putative quinol monooxygenase [Proteobacteria bacterium]|nr:putative quinol monooxygenase [Pseudomonadota bacterium]MDA1326087.1 putative quinol monooxygenase [Pseudomonadota bacterium]
MALSLFVTITLKPGTRDKFVEVATGHRGRVLDREPGCHRFDILLPDDAENQVCLYEVYEDQAAFDLHGGTDYMAAYREQTGDMVAGRDRVMSTIVA